jgi:hypothetical protein
MFSHSSDTWLKQLLEKYFELYDRLWHYCASGAEPVSCLAPRLVQSKLGMNFPTQMPRGW